MTDAKVLSVAAATVVATAAPLPVAAAIPDEYVVPVLIQGVDYVDWWDEAELRAILRAFAPFAKARKE